MKFNKPLLAVYIFFAVLNGCSSNPEKPADGNFIEQSEQASAAPANLPDAEKATVPMSRAPSSVPSPVLPPGPVMSNPYLQNPQRFAESIEINFHAAVASMQQKNWSHAETVLKQLAEKNPRLSGVYVNLGIVYRHTGDAEKAASAFERAISANMKNVEAYNQLAVLKREAGDFKAAEELYKRALTIWPFYPEGHKNIAILYDLYTGKPEQALPHYQAYQQLLPAPDKQVDSWIADLQRRLNVGKAPAKTEENK